ncbi:MAG: hypothetical protein VB036_11370 [Propionicimonas sp.]|nr:hypothetical protein [Propionicimonas sp.]
MTAGEVTREFGYGNLWLIACCAFYLLWWLLAFKPVNPVHGIRSGWLLIPASLAGVIAVFVVIRAGLQALVTQSLFATQHLLLAGAISYVVVALVTYLAWARPVTAELFLIVGWAVLALYQVNTLFGMQVFARPQAVGFAVLVLVVLAGCLVCYTVYYRLDAVAGYVVGAVPLVLGAVVMGVLTYAGSTGG